MTLWMSALACTLGQPVYAAEVTAMPAALRGDVLLDYRGSWQRGGLDEMLYDPYSGTGTYTGGSTIDGPIFQGGGAHGFLIGGAFAPLSEMWRRNFGISWRLDLGYRTPSPKQTLFTGPDGERGAAPGGHALVVGAAFSARRGRSNPYLDFDFVFESPARVDVVDAEGAVVESDLRVYPASTIDMTVGVELIASENTERQSRVDVDLFLGFGYRSWEDLPSGFNLPSVLDATRDVPVTRSDYVLMSMGIDYDINKWIGLHADIAGRYFTPHQLENVYDVYTGADTFEITWRFGLVGRVRLKDD